MKLVNKEIALTINRSDFAGPVWVPDWLNELSHAYKLYPCTCIRETAPLFYNLRLEIQYTW